MYLEIWQMNTIISKTKKMNILFYQVQLYLAPKPINFHWIKTGSDPY